MNIEEWLTAFCANWQNQNIDAVMQLFDADVEYWESPHKKLDSSDQLKSEWQAIHTQHDIHIETNVFSSINDAHSVLWTVSYKNEDGEPQNWAGTYLIKLNSAGKCVYFYHCGEKDT